MEITEQEVLGDSAYDIQKGWFIGFRDLFDRVTPNFDSAAAIAEEAIGVVTTVGRYALTTKPMVGRVREGKSILIPGVTAVLGDVYDGVMTRWASEKLLGRPAEDTPFRRVLDGVLDQVTVMRVGYEVAKKNPSAIPYLGVIGVRSLVAGGGFNGVHLVATGEVTKGRKWQKAVNLTAGVFGIAAASGNRKATHITGLVASLVAVGTAPIHLKEFRQRKGRVFREL